MTARVNHPPHYKGHKSGVECIEITRHESFCIGNAIKYIWRHKDKGKPVEDLRKAIWYLEDQIALYEAAADVDQMAREFESCK